MLFHLEDERMLAEIMHTAITAYDPHVEIVHFVNSDNALTFIKEHLAEINVYVLDVRVPGSLTGVELAQKVRELGFTGSIYINSAYRKPSQAVLDAYQCEWMEKPWHILNAAQILAPLAKKQRV